MTHHPVHDAVGQLIRTQSMEVHVTAEVSYVVRAPCLLAQLAEATVHSGREAGSRGVPGSRPPIAVDAWDLWHRIQHNTHSWARHLGLDRRRYLGAPQSRGELSTPPVGILLRACAAQAVSVAMVPVADAIMDSARTWHGQITTMLTGQATQRGVRGATCGQCGQASAVEQRDGETWRVPAIVLVTQTPDGVVYDGIVLRWLACQACGWCAPVDEAGTVVEVAFDVGTGEGVAA